VRGGQSGFHEITPPKPIGAGHTPFCCIGRTSFSTAGTPPKAGLITSGWRVEICNQKRLASVEVARRFGYTPGSFRVLCHAFRRDPDREFFLPPAKGPRAAPKMDSAREQVVALRKQNLPETDSQSPPGCGRLRKYRRRHPLARQQTADLYARLKNGTSVPNPFLVNNLRNIGRWLSGGSAARIVWNAA
jgi:hypothetical protein